MKRFLKSFGPSLLAGTIILCLGVEAGLKTRGYFAFGGEWIAAFFAFGIVFARMWSGSKNEECEEE